MDSFRHTMLAMLLGMLVAHCAAQQGTPWVMQSSGTDANLRGIDSVNDTVAWAAGADGTVLRTTDGGQHWRRCATPDAEKDGATLDFRGVQAWNAETAVVMSSGSGDKSRLYKTTDGCKTWKLLFTNPDSPNGFFDSFWFNGPRGILLGDPVKGRVTVFLTENKGKTWKRDPHPGLLVRSNAFSAFAASNSCIPIGNALFARAFVAGGQGGALFFTRPFTSEEERHGLVDRIVRKELPWKSRSIPIRAGTESSGAFSVAYRYPVTEGICPNCGFDENSRFVAVGGDYTKPRESAATAAYSTDGGWTWTASAVSPHGYRSAVQWSETLKLWVTVGTNGSDVSRDDGRTWQPLDNGSWNALSLPFVVGPKGRIAHLNSAALPKS